MIANIFDADLWAIPKKLKLKLKKNLIKKYDRTS